MVWQYESNDELNRIVNLQNAMRKLGLSEEQRRSDYRTSLTDQTLPLCVAAGTEHSVYAVARVASLTGQS